MVSHLQHNAVLPRDLRNTTGVCKYVKHIPGKILRAPCLCVPTTVSRSLSRSAGQNAQQTNSVHSANTQYAITVSYDRTRVVHARCSYAASQTVPEQMHKPLTGLLRGFGGMPNCASSGTATTANVNIAASVLIAGSGVLAAVSLHRKATSKVPQRQSSKTQRGNTQTSTRSWGKDILHVPYSVV